MKSANFKLCTLLLALGSAISPGSSFGAPIPPLPVYSVTDIGFLPGFREMNGTGINIRGEIVGTAYTGFDQDGVGTGGHGFLYHRGKLVDFGAGSANAINAWGEVLGLTPDSPFIYRDGKLTLLTGASALNDLGQIVIFEVGGVQVRERNGKIVSTPIGDPTENLFVAWAINDLGQVIGRDFVPATASPNDFDFFNNVILVQPGGSYRTIATGPENSYCFPLAMNIFGQAVGYNINLYFDTIYQDEFYDFGHATLYNPNGNMVTLGNLPILAPFPEGIPPASEAKAINSFGVIVGYSQIQFEPNKQLGFVYLNGTMYDLNALVNSTGQGLTIVSANGINDLGQIVGTAVDAAGTEHAVILSVVGAKFNRPKTNLSDLLLPKATGLHKMVADFGLSVH